MIRLATLADLAAINTIYNQAVAHKFQTADTEPISIGDRTAWFQNHSPEVYPVYVYVREGKITGWASLSRYRKGRKVLQRTAEISYYIHIDEQRKGLGTQLIQYTIEAAKALNYTTLIAILLDTNAPSIHVLKKFGFQEWGRMPKVAIIDHQEYDHIYYGLRITP